MGYLFLALTIIFETAAVICMKLSDGFQQKTWAGSAVITYSLSFIFLSLALKLIPAGIENVTWGR